MDAASTSMSSQTGGDLQTEIDPKTGQVRPRSVSYQARVPLDTSEMLLRPGYRGAAKVHVDPMSLGQRLWRVIIKTFNFDF
jgi:putative peptide zinc metalloprotease protein